MMKINPESRKYIKLLESQKRVICGFKQNMFGEAIVTTGIPREYNEGVITYVDKKSESYESYMLKKSLNRR